MKTLREKIRSFQSEYKKISKFKMAYNTASDLTRKTNKIILHVLIFDPVIGHTIWAQRYKRAEHRTHKQWSDWLKEKGLPIFVDRILPVVNQKFAHEYKLIRVILWEMVNEFPEFKDTTMVENRDLPK